MADNYTEYAKQYGPSGWFDDPTSQSYKGAHGSEVSTTLALYRESVKARFATTGPVDALPLIGDTRQLERAPGEAEADYRVRLTQAFPIHRQRTTEDGYRNALAPLEVDSATVYAWNWYQAGVGQWWSTVWIVVDMTSLDPWQSGPDMDTGLTLDAGLVMDVAGLTTDGLSYIRRTIRKYKWTGAYPVAIWVIFAGQVMDMGLTMDALLTMDTGTNEGAIIPLGRVWDQEWLLWGTSPAKMDTGSTLDNAFFV